MVKELLDVGDMVYLRDCQDHLFPNTCTIDRAGSLDPNVRGSVTKVFATINDNEDVPCRLFWGLRNREAAGAQGQRFTRDMEVFTSQWMVTMAHDQDLVVGDRLTFGDEQFLVTGLNVEKSFQTATRANLDRVNA